MKGLKMPSVVLSDMILFTHRKYTSIHTSLQVEVRKIYILKEQYYFLVITTLNKKSNTYAKKFKYQI